MGVNVESQTQPNKHQKKWNNLVLVLEEIICKTEYTTHHFTELQKDSNKNKLHWIKEDLITDTTNTYWRRCIPSIFWNSFRSFSRTGYSYTSSNTFLYIVYKTKQCLNTPDNSNIYLRHHMSGLSQFRHYSTKTSFIIILCKTCKERMFLFKFTDRSIFNILWKNTLT